MNLMTNLTKFQRVMEAPAEGGTGGAPAGDPPAPAAGNEPPSTDFSWVPEEYRGGDDGPDFAAFSSHYNEVIAQRAIAEEALSNVPADGAGYELAIPENLDFGELDLPEGFEVQLSTDDPVVAPMFEELGGLLHKHNIPKDAAGEFMGLLARYEAAKFSGLYSQGQAELQQLGNGHASRIANVKHILESQLPSEMAEALMGATVTANGVKALEKLLATRSMASPTPTPPEAKEEDPLAARYPHTS